MFIIGPLQICAQERDTIPSEVDIILPSDSITLYPDSAFASADSTGADSLNSDAVIKSEVVYSASDSIDNDVVNKVVYLYGNAKIEYEDITLTGAKIVYDFDSYTVHAEGIQDTLGNWIGLPVFKQGQSEFEAREMDYNFKSKKAFVKQVETDIVEGTLTGKTVKTTQDNRVIYIKNGEYCPCEDPNALTRFKIGKLKVIKDDKIVSGPGYLALGKIPTPLAFPFGFFPNAEKRQAGIVIPSYGNAQSQGFFLADGGFYLPIGDNWDTKMLFDAYSRGSWGLENLTRYKKRYKFDGNFNVEYNNNVRGDRDLNNFSAQKNFFLTWMHTQDRKARPNSNFSADIRAGSTANYQNNLNSSQNDYLTNTFRSNIRYSKSFFDSPWNIALNAGHSQNSRTGNYDFTLPEVSLNRARTFPLDGLFNDSPKQQFYEKIGITYNGAFQNSLSVQENELALNNISGLMQKFRNGVRHSASVTTSLKAGPLSINPGFNYTERWYFETYDRRFDEDSQAFVPDTVKGFDRNGNWDFRTSMTTKVYGMFNFRRGNIKAIRHTLTPSLTYSYRPDFDPRVYGFFGNDGSLASFSPYEGGIYGGPPAGESQLLTFSLVNNLEAKVLNRNDTTSRFKKVPIFENITASASYNLSADSLQLSPISVAGRTKITQYANINFQANFDAYTYAANENGAIRRVDAFRYSRDGKLASFESGRFALNSSGLGSASFKGSKQSGDVIEADDEEDLEEKSPVVERKKSFFRSEAPTWNITFGYALTARTVRNSIMLNEGFAIEDSLDVTQSIQFNGDIKVLGRLRISVNSGYDFVREEFTPTTVLVNLDLNCWEFNARIVPFGLRRSYNLSINIKSSMLRDLKLERNRNISSEENFFL